MAEAPDIAELPDALLQRAWDRGLDRRAIIRRGTDAAMLLLADRNELPTLFWPAPRPLEPVSHWSQNHREVNAIPERLRPFASAVAPACVLGYAITKIFVAPHASIGESQLALLGTIGAVWLVLGVLFTGLIALTLRRRIARLDEERAFAIVLSELRRGMAGNAKLVPMACKWIREEFPGLAGSSG